MATIKNRRKIESGKIFDAYFDASEKDKLDTVIIQKGRPFGAGTYPEEYPSFDWNGKTYAITAYDHHNGHFSKFTDRSAIYGLYIGEVIF